MLARRRAKYVLWLGFRIPDNGRCLGQKNKVIGIFQEVKKEMAKNNREPDCETQHVLQICHTSEPPFLDCARQYAALFEKTEYTVITIFLSGSKPDQMDVRLPGTEAIFLNYQSAGLKGLKVGLIKTIRKIAYPLNLKLIIAHRYKPTYIALRIKDVPVVAVNHAFGVYHRWARCLMVGRNENRVLLLGVSNAVRDDLRASLPKFSSDKIECLYNRIDRGVLASSQLDKTGARVNLGLDVKAYIFGNVGRLHPDKDQKTLIKAFALVSEKIPNACLVLIGSGEDRLMLETLSAELKVADKVKFLGNVPDASKYFKAFDSFLLSSDEEPFGMVLLEAMTANLPVVCTSTGGGAEVVGSDGMLFDKGDCKRLSELMQRIYDEKNNFDINYEPRIKKLFSDESARSRFWGFSEIKKFDI
ncbi:MAG: glycosyltransferase [Porticoccaceae bacterium]